MSKGRPNKTILSLARQTFCDKERAWSYAGAHILETESSKELHVNFMDAAVLESFSAQFAGKLFCGIPIHFHYAAPDWGSQPEKALI